MGRVIDRARHYSSKSIERLRNRLIKTSSIAVETLRLTSQSDSIVRQTNKP